MSLLFRDASKIWSQDRSSPEYTKVLSSGGLYLVDHPSMTSNDKLDRTATHLAVLDRSISPSRGVHERGKNRPTIRANHLDIFFEVHELDCSSILTARLP